MKKLISFLLCATIALSPVFASKAVCAHSYTEADIAATCSNRAHTLKTCSLCGDTEAIYSPLYSAPDGCYFLLEGEMSGNVLNVTVTLNNNPGFWANRLTLNYNSAALEVASTTKGDVWPASASVTVNTESSTPYVRFYGDDTALQNNTKNGLIFAVSFKIKGEMSDWGLSLSAKSRDNINVDGNAVPFKIVETVTLGYGDHVYDEGVVITEPTYISTGMMKYTCTICKDTKTEQIPVLDVIPGDVNLSGRIESQDMLIIKMYLVGIKTNMSNVEYMDANSDGFVNAKDLLYLKKVFLGII